MKLFPLRKLALTLLAGLMLTPAYAAITLKPGDTAPDFTLNTVSQQEVHLNELTSKGEVVLVVLRGWPGYQCPACTAQGHDFIQHAEKLKTAGVQVVMVYPGPAAELTQHASEFMQEKSWPQNLLLVMDPNYTFTAAYGLRWDKPNETAYPATLIIGKDGKITFAHISHQHGDRVKAETVLAKVSASMP